VTDVTSHWKAIDTLVKDIGALAVDVQMAERTLATDPRTSAARRALDSATDAVCVAIDESSEAAAAQANRAIEEARGAVVKLGLTLQNSRSLIVAARDISRRLEDTVKTSAALRDRAERRRKGDKDRSSPRTPRPNPRGRG
jgi:hypothetical protein